MRMPFDDLYASLKLNPPLRVKGTAVFMTQDPEGTPPALLHQLKHNQVLHEQVVILTILTTTRAGGADRGPRRGDPARARLLAGHRALRLHGDAERPRGHAARGNQGLATFRDARATSSDARPSSRPAAPTCRAGGGRCSCSSPATRARRRSSSASPPTTSSSSARRSRCEERLPVARPRQRDRRQPAARASASEQNQRSPRAGSMSVCA